MGYNPINYGYITHKPQWHWTYSHQLNANELGHHPVRYEKTALLGVTPNWHFLSRSIWDYLTFYLAFCLAFYLIYILTFDLTFYLTLRLHSIISCGLFDTYSPIFFFTFELTSGWWFQPVWKILKSMGRIIPYISIYYGKNVWNHQPDILCGILTSDVLDFGSHPCSHRLWSNLLFFTTTPR